MFTAILRRVFPGQFVFEYEGPARLELPRCGFQVGWVRSSGSTIQILSIDGTASIYRAKSVCRLTPISFKELAAFSSDKQDVLTSKENNIQRLMKSFHARLEWSEKRNHLLRHALGAIQSELGLALSENGKSLIESNDIVADAVDITAKALKTDTEMGKDDTGKIWESSSFPVSSRSNEKKEG